ncbi:MAG: energy transducer TonB [Gammaproteobacteria bacterium]
MPLLSSYSYCRRLGLLLLLSGVLISVSWAQALSQPRVDTSRAQILKQPGPKYPRDSKKRGQEGWVMLSFMVNKKGGVTDALIEDSSGVTAFEKEALKVVKKWRYEPATYDGEPVEQRQTRLVLTYAMDIPRRGAGLRFREGYNSVQERLSEQDYDGAQREWQTLADFNGWNLYETARLWALYALVGEAQGDNAQALTGLLRATRGGGSYLEKDFYAAALRKMFVLQLRADNRAGALVTYGRLERRSGALDGFEQLTEAAVTLRERLQASEVLAAEARVEVIAGKPFWTRRLLRRDVELFDIRGKLESIDFRCDWGRVKDKAVTGKRWQLPRELGDCDVYVYGRKGSRFSLLQFPAVPES